MIHTGRLAGTLAGAALIAAALAGCSGGGSHPAAAPTVTRHLPLLPQRTALTSFEPVVTVVRSHIGTGDKKFSAGEIGAANLIVQIVCDGPGTVTVLGNTVGPCVGAGVWTNQVPWSKAPKELRVEVKADRTTAWSLYIAARS